MALDRIQSDGENFLCLATNFVDTQTEPEISCGKANMKEVFRSSRLPRQRCLQALSCLLVFALSMVGEVSHAPSSAAPPLPPIGLDSAPPEGSAIDADASYPKSVDAMARAGSARLDNDQGGSSSRVSVQSSEVDFNDVGGRFYTEAVEGLAANGVLTPCDSGAEKFCPDEPIDRKTMAVWLIRVLEGGDPEDSNESPFRDVSDQSHPSAVASIVRLAELGTTTGCGDGSYFCPEDPVTRGQMATFLSRAFKLSQGGETPFTDVPEGAFYESHVSNIYGAAIANGCSPTTFCPDDETTRGQMAAFLSRAINSRDTGATVDSGSLKARGPEVTDATTDAEESVDDETDGGPTIAELYPDRIKAFENALRENSRSEIVCPRSTRALSREYVIVTRFENGCLFRDERDLNGRTLRQAREEYGLDPTVLSVTRPTQLVPGALKDAGILPWHLNSNHLDVASLERDWPANASVRVAVLDTGVDAGHPSLNSKVESIDNAVLSGRIANCNSGYTSDTKSHNDTHGHGTAVAGIINQVSSRTIIVPIEAIKSLSLSDAIECAIQANVDIINMSFGRPPTTGVIEGIINTYRSDNNLILNSAATSEEDVIQRAIDQGIVLISSAGNCGEGEWSYPTKACGYHNFVTTPASYRNVISVAATDANKRRWSHSTANWTVDIAAPGEQVVTAKAGRRPPDSLASRTSGTSLASPAIAGVVAHMKARCPSATPAQILDALTSTTYRPAQYEAYRNDDLGYGIVKPRAAVEYLLNRLQASSDETCFAARPPDAPVVRATIEGADVTAAWSTNDNGDEVTGWEVRDVGLVDSSQLSYTFSDKPPGRYSVVVRARNSNGWSPWAASNPVTVPQKSTRPDEPEIRVTVDGTNLIAHWSANDNGIRINSWLIMLERLFESDSNLFWEGVDSVSFFGPLSSRSWSDLDPGLYRVQVRASNDDGSSDWGTSDSVSVLDPTEPPSRPSVSVRVDGSTLDASWTANDNGSPITSYEVTISGSGSFTTSATSRTWSNLRPGTYTVTVRARNASGSSASGSDSGTIASPEEVPTEPPSRPSVSVRVDGSTLDASWTANDNGSPITSYEVTISGSGSFTTSATSRTWSNLRPGTYTVTVRARNAHGWSPARSDTGRIVPDDPPSMRSVSVSVSGSSLTAWWSAIDNGSPITSYEVTISGSGSFTTSATSRTWSNLRPGTYTVTVRARNTHGLSPAGSDSDTIPYVIIPTRDPDCSVVSLGTVNGSVRRSGSYVRGCGSNLRGSSYYARRYRFTVGSSSNVRINLSSSVDTYLYLLNSSGREITRNDDWGSGSDSQIERELSAGTYIVEATTYDQRQTGRYTLSVLRSDPAVVIIPTPARSVNLTKGTSAQGQPGCRSRYCRFLDVSLNNFQSGSYRFECHSDSGRFYSQVLSSNRISRPVCYFGYPGENVWVVVDGVRSNSVRW